MGRIVLFGATGYTGRLTARALVERGAEPRLAARSRTSLDTLSAELGGGLETAVADVEQPGTVRALLEPGDVLLSTVGPFAKWGDPAVQAAIEARAPYLDSTGEPAFIRRVFERFGPAAAAAETPLLTAMGYDWVPGNLAAALALTEAGEAARLVEIGYFLTGGGGGASGGTLASMAGVVLEPGFAYREGSLRSEPNASRSRSFAVRGHDRPGLSVSSSEHFAIPAQFPRVANVEAFIAAPRFATKVLQVGGYALAGLSRVPYAKGGIEKLIERFVKGSTGGPSEEDRAASGTHVLAIARDASGRALSEVRLEGVNAYTFTAAILAWAAARALEGGVEGVGALGPAQAFGVQELEAGVAEAGISRV